MDSPLRRDPAGARGSLERGGFRTSVFLAGSALVLFGLIRVVFNSVGVRVFGAAYLGDVNVSLSWVTVLAVLIAAVPTVLGAKFIGEYLGRGERERAGRLLGGLLVGTIAVGTAAATAAAVLLPAGTRVLAPYVPLLAIYLLLKAAYFAFGLARRYFRTEILSAAAFFAVFAGACSTGSTRLATLSLLTHPALFALLAIADHRGEMRVRGAFAEVHAQGRVYAAFSLATLVNAVAGLGSYHLVVVLAGVFLADRATVGYLGVLLAALSPLNLLPLALGTVLLPELALRFGASDEEGQRSLVRRSVLALEVATLVAALPLLAFPEGWMTLFGVPTRPDLVRTWGWLALSAALSTVSSPCGHYLNATRHVHRHALASGSFFVMGTALGVALFPPLGAMAAGLMRFGVDGGSALARIVLAERLAGWAAGGARAALAVGLGVVLLGFGVGAAGAGTFSRLAVCGAGWLLALVVAGLLRPRNRPASARQPSS